MLLKLHTRFNEILPISELLTEEEKSPKRSGSPSKLKTVEKIFNLHFLTRDLAAQCDISALVLDGRKLIFVDYQFSTVSFNDC